MDRRKTCLFGLVYRFHGAQDGFFFSYSLCLLLLIIHTETTWTFITGVVDAHLPCSLTPLTVTLNITCYPQRALLASCLCLIKTSFIIKRSNQRPVPPAHRSQQGRLTRPRQRRHQSHVPAPRHPSFSGTRGKKILPVDQTP